MLMFEFHGKLFVGGQTKDFFVNLLETNARFLQKNKDAFMKANALVLFFFSGLPFFANPLGGPGWTQLLAKC